MPLHLYGVVRASHPVPERLVGVRDGAVRTVGSPGADVVVAATEVAGGPGEHVVTEDDAVRHLDVLTALLADGPVLPLRLGTLAPDEDDVRRELLEGSAEEWSRHLDAVDGLVEVHVDVSDDEDERLRAVVTEDPSLRASRGADGSLEERVRLGETVTRRLADLRAVDAEQVLSRLVRHSVADAGREGGDGWVLRHAFLLRAEHLADLDADLDELAREHGGRLRFDRVGPVPVVSFSVQSQGGGSRWGW